MPKIHKIYLPYLLLSLLLSGASHVLAEQLAITTRDSSILQTPKRTSEQVTPIKQGEAIRILKRKGGWYQVTYTSEKTSKTGWLPLLHVRFQTEAEENEQSIAEILRQTAEMPTAAGVTSGVRGMSSQRLQGASEEGGELKSLESLDKYIPTEDDMDDFIERGELKLRDDIKLDTPEE